jgi:HEAT repeat protein
MADVDRLLDELRSDDWRVASRAAEALADVPGRQVTAGLAAALDASDTAVTQAAVATLVRRDDEEPIEAMWQVMSALEEDQYDEVWFFLQQWPESRIVQALEERHRSAE